MGELRQLDGAIDTTTESDDSVENNEGLIKIKNDLAVRLLLTNARSLKPKTASLLDAFDSLGLNLSCITETWYRGGKDLREHLQEVEASSGIRIVHKSRDGRGKKFGGGVAIAFDTSSCNFKRRDLKHIDKNHEIICVVGRVGKIERPVAVFAIYIPPALKKAEVNRLKELLAVEIAAVRSSHKNPVILVTGDLNHQDISAAIGEVGDFGLLDSGPTRGANTIDLIHSNVPDLHSETFTLPPLQATNGALSDHKCVYTELVFPQQRGYHWVVKMRRTRDAKREADFAADMLAHNWETEFVGQDASQMATSLERVVGELTERHFPLVRIRKRSTEHPWITRAVRRLWRRKIRIYRKEGRSQAWWRTDGILQEKLRDARNSFVEVLLEDGNSGRSFYSATKKLAGATKAGEWKVQDLFNGREPAAICEEILGFYGKVSGQRLGPMPDAIPCTGGLGHFTESRTEELLGKAKKTDSRVDGDPLAHLVRRFPKAFASPVAAIFNKINGEGVWPRSWKTEHLTIIPKVPNPSSLSECRNISCTSIFSKVLEGVVLDQLRRELIPDPAQYGGNPKCGTEHMLIDIWEEILAPMEGGKSAAVLLGVDYEKAFNRMDHSVCLSKLRTLGASDGSIAMVRAFLDGRCMTVSIDGCKGQPVPLLRGSPQGSVLGCLLYCVTTQFLTKDLRPEPVRYFPNSEGPEDDVRFWDPDPPTAFLYVDDTTLVDGARLDGAARHITTEKTVESFNDLRIGLDFDELSVRAKDIGMKINESKTQLLIISPPNGCDTVASFTTREGTLVNSVPKMKLVGFTFGSTPNAAAHVESLEDRYRSKKWMLYHLRDAGFRGRQLFKLYACYVRSILEYCSPVYHSLLNDGQERQLERLHHHAIRICYGHDTPVAAIMESECIESLKSRRIRRMDTFIKKAASNPRFGGWFPRRRETPWVLRNRREIEETRTSSLRRFNSPLAYIKRRANELGILPST